MQRFCIILVLALIWHKTLQQEGGKNDGEPDYDSEGLLEKLAEEEYTDGGSEVELNYRQSQGMHLKALNSKILVMCYSKMNE